ncbi:hypothetical protein GCM10010913_32300 [Paenibacillus aceti]|uniref:Uncharacterized protein n=1 Tax=Paenibacillus aceti TaxID=1820010 RepID=A0ABQ1W0Q7_9BACL|nr:hypothetical protein GCM10010913_32300 [Paenibacillus aceti]
MFSWLAPYHLWKKLMYNLIYDIYAEIMETFGYSNGNIFVTIIIELMKFDSSFKGFGWKMSK